MQILLGVRLVSLPLYHARLSILTKFVDGTRWRRHRKRLMINKCSCKSNKFWLNLEGFCKVFWRRELIQSISWYYNLIILLVSWIAWSFACPVSRELATRPYMCHFRSRLPGKAFQTVFEQHPDSLVRVVQVWDWLRLNSFCLNDGDIL